MRFKALKEWAEGAGLRKSQPEAEGRGRPREEGGWGGDRALHSYMSPNVTTISWAHPLSSSQKVQGSPLDFLTSASKVWGPSSQPCSCCTGPAAVTQTST